jgi:hypothetical protein
MICISCKHEHQEKFCPNCGEKSDVKKITFTSIIENAFSTITNMDKGFLFNIKALITNPAKITNDFILGKRKGILNPISFLIISISIYLIVESFFKIPNDQLEPIVNSEGYSKGYIYGRTTGKLIYIYLKYFLIFSIFLLGNSTKIIFNKYNYLEHISISSFIIGLAVLLSTITYLIFRIPILFNPILYIVIFMMVYSVFTAGERKFDSSLSSFSALILFIIQLIIVILIAGLIMA